MLFFLSFLILGADLGVKHGPGLGPSVSISYFIDFLPLEATVFQNCFGNIVFVSQY